MPGRDIVVIGGSAGSIEALHELFGALPRAVEAALFIVVHRGPAYHDLTLSPLRRLARMPLHFALDGERIARGRAYVCSSDRHLLVDRARVRVEASPAENLYRPSIDALFRSAAHAYSRRVVGVLLSGLLKDGTAGLWQIKKRGGVAIVQDPQSAKFAQMPQNALANVPVDYCLPPSSIARTIAALAEREQPAPAGARRARVLIVEDERIVAKNLERRLTELGYEVSGSAASGEEALELCDRAPPDVVLMDIHLAGELDGTETARRVWERFQIPVVYVTAYADTATLDEAKITEPYGYVVKPFRPEQIHAALQLALERRSRETGEPL